MSRYAQNTNVSANKSMLEIEKTLSRFGAHGFVYGWKDNKAIICFELMNRRLKFELTFPSIEDEQFRKTPTGRIKKTGVNESYKKEINRKWRSLALLIKAKLVSVGDNIRLFDQEFQADILLPNGKTVGEWIRPQLLEAYENKKMPPLLDFKS